MSFNGACASSLQALHAAVRSLQLNRIDIALAAGASYCHSDTMVLFSQAQSLSPTGSRPFDNEADGLVVGEGYVAVVLKRLSDAIRHKDPIFGVVQGISIASDGKGKSLWAPRKEGQVSAIHRAYPSREAMKRIQYIEAHATSTQLGDATELQALQEAFSNLGISPRSIPIGSVKANVGHTLESAGLASLLKVLLCMEHETLPAHTRLGQLNDRVDWEQLSFYVPREFSRWNPDEHGNRCAAVNGFGIGGLNAHVVVSQFPGRNQGVRNVPGAAGHLLPPSENDHSTIADGIYHRAASASYRKSPPQIAIIGAGCVLPGALNSKEFRSLLADPKQTAISDIPAGRWTIDPNQPGSTRYPIRFRQGGFVKSFTYDWKRHKVPPKQIASASPLQFMILDAVSQAIDQTGMEFTTERRARTGVVVGTMFGGDFSNQLQMGLRIPELKRRLSNQLEKENVPQQLIEKLVDQLATRILEKMPALLDETGSFTSSSLASRITKSYDLGGGAVAVDGGHGSSGAALSYCMDQLLSGDNDFMFCIGAHQDMSPTRIEAWNTVGWYGRGKGGDPLSLNDEGVAPAEGCVVLLLQRVDSERSCVTKPLAWLRGLGSGSGRWGDQIVRNTIQRALRDAALPEETEVEEVRLSPMGISAIDRPYFEGCSRLGIPFRKVNDRPIEGNSFPLSCQVPLRTSVGKIGHTAGASGLVEILTSLVNHQETDPAASARSTINYSSVSLASEPNSAELYSTAGKLSLCLMGSPWETTYGFILEKT
jgi:acyl transferase domain-containing protein